MTRIYVIDAGVLISTWTDKKKDASFITTPGILQEVRNRLSKFRAETLFLLEKMQQREPSHDAIAYIESTATQTGDSSVLSKNDIDLIALAYMLKNEGFEPTLVSTDFAVLNTASQLNLPIIDPNDKFSQRITWGLKCPACNYKTKSRASSVECPVCGTTMRRTPLKKNKKS